MIDAANNALADETQQVKLDNTSENYRWISLDANQAVAAGEDKYVTESLLRLQAWNPEYILDGICACNCFLEERNGVCCQACRFSVSLTIDVFLEYFLEYSLPILQ
jgi:hypothetical protein